MDGRYPIISSAGESLFLMFTLCMLGSHLLIYFFKNKARIFSLVDLPEFFSDLGSGGTKKIIIKL